MLETVITIGVVLLAAAAIGFSFYRIAAGENRGCCGGGGASCPGSGGCADTEQNRSRERSGSP